MTPIRKSGRCSFKALKTPGEFTAEFSVYGNVDLDGDRITKGALVPALAKNPNPAIVWTHMWEIPPIGETLDAKSTDGGGVATGRLFLDDHEVARQVWAGLSSEKQALDQFSFAFNIGASEMVEAKGEDTPRKDGRIREISEISDIFEWGPTLLGANPATSTLELAKSRRLLDSLAKGYDDIDGWSIYCLTSMIGWGVDFIEAEDDPADVTSMKEILSNVLALLGKEMAEDDAGAVLASAIAEVQKIRKEGARHSSEDVGLLQQIHDLTNTLGIACYATSTGDIMGNDEANVLASANAAKLLASRPMLHLHS